MTNHEKNIIHYKVFINTSLCISCNSVGILYANNAQILLKNCKKSQVYEVIEQLNATVLSTKSNKFYFSILFMWIICLPFRNICWWCSSPYKTLFPYFTPGPFVATLGTTIYFNLQSISLYKILVKSLDWQIIRACPFKLHISFSHGGLQKWPH